MVYTIKNKAFPSNTYLLTIDGSKDCIIIDPGIDADLIEYEIETNGLSPIAILCTHGHFDHIANVSLFQERYSIPFYIHRQDLKTVKSANFFMKITKVNFILKTPQPDIILDGETSDLSIGNFHLNVRLFPGHSPGSCVLQQGKYLFTGDILYKKGLGFNSFPDEKRDILKDSINRIFETYSDDSIVLPGHGAAENIGNIKKNNLELKAFLQNELV